MATRTKPRLTPTLKKVYVRAIELIEENWIQGHWLKDLDTGKTYGTGAVENGQRFAVCAVGGLQRAAWEVLGKPDMSIEENINKVESLVLDADVRACAFISDDFEEEWDNVYLSESLMEVNDSLPAEAAKQSVLDFMRRAANLPR